MKKGLTFQKLLAVVTASVVLFAAAVASQPVVSKYQSVDWKKAEANYIAALASDNLGIKQSAAIYIGEYQLKGAVVPLIEILKSDKVEKARMSAALALVTLDDNRARAAVEEAALYDGSDKVAKFCESLLNASPKKFSALE
jgi:HEAT repeat protein